MKVCSLIWSAEKPELHRWAHSMHQGPQERTNGCSLASLWKLSYQQLPSCRKLMDGHPCGNWSTLSHSIVSLEPSFLWLLHPLSSFSKGSYPVWPQQMLVLFPHCMIHLNPNLHLCFQEVRVIKLTSETLSHNIYINYRYGLSITEISSEGPPKSTTTPHSTKKKKIK